MEDPLDDAVKRMLRGDDDAFRTVYRSVQPRLERYLTALVGPNEAEDVASDTWAQACRDMSSFTGDADGFRGWVTTIGRHRALDHLRAKGRRPQSAGTIEEFPEWISEDDVESSVEAILSTGAAIEMIASLPQEQAEAVLLRAVMGLDAKTAGRILGRSAGAVRTAAYRGLGTLAKRSPRPLGDNSGGNPAEEVR
ncbi:MAG: RNA polymerase sigma factor [Propionibacteriales bacterium]|nr:RNA polymerase sigma factor [Propionibacteriales bacterium]